VSSPARYPRVVASRPVRAGALAVVAALVLAPALARAAGAPEAAADPGAAAVRTYCAGCHHETSPGHFDRISSLRKTPEGWSMTLFRMKQVHGLALAPADRDLIVRHLADTQGLAPSESAEGRFALERRPNAQDLVVDAETDRVCGRCHSNARASLQRRDAGEWLKLAHTHVGQWPSLEYQASARDRRWWEIATTKMPAELGRRYPFETAAWTAWRSRPARDLSGAWVVVGRVPGRGDYYGTATISRTAAGEYAARYQLTMLDGSPLAGTSKAIVYTGYEWRGTGELGGRETREVYAASEDGTRLAGRWFDPEHAEDGGDWLAVRADAPPQVLAVLPRAAKAGTSARVVVVGTGLDAAAAPSFGPGTRATVVERTGSVLRADVAVAADAALGAHEVAVGTATPGRLAVYRQVDRVAVAPAYGIARLGGGRIAPVAAQFEAQGFARLPDGSELSLGILPATWQVEPFDEEARRLKDVHYAGRLEGAGRFVPAGAGPNPEREFSGNNVGNLAVVARVADGATPVEGRAHLIVTVQRWNTPPIY
jgi:quinohemoprotein amine dehydrogenase